MSSDPDGPTKGAPAAPASPSLLSRAVGALSQRSVREEVLIVASLLGVCLWVRWLRLSHIDYYEDTINKWHFVRQWFYANDFSHATWTHHMARMGVNVPVFLTMILFGRTAYVYYAAPVLNFLVQALFLYLLGRRLGGRAVGVFAVLFRTAFTGMDQGSCQLLPDGFGGTAILLVAYLIVRYQEARDEERMRWLVGAGLAFVWAYLIKESNVLFGPGAFLTVWAARRRLKDALLLAAIPALGALVETILFGLFTNYSSRLAIVEDSHGEATVTFFELFDRFTKPGQSWQMLFWLWLSSALWLCTSTDKRVRGIVLIPAAFLFLMTFLVRSVNPIVLWQRFQNRYFDAVGPLLMIAIALFFVELARRIWTAGPPTGWRGLLARASRHGGLVTFVASLTIGSFQAFSNYENDVGHPFNRIRNMMTIVNDAYRRNLPIVEKRAEKGQLEERRVRPLKAIYGVYLKDEYLASSDIAKHGELPDLLNAVRDDEHYSYVLRNYGAYRPGELERLVEDGCGVRVTERNKTTIVERETKLPDRCKAPRGKGYHR